MSNCERDELLQLYRQRLDAFLAQRDEEVTCSLFRSLRLPSPFPHPQPDQQPAGALLPLPCWQARRLLANAGGRTDFRGIKENYCQHETGCIFCTLG